MTINIDEVTGLPIIGNEYIDQVPLDSQVFPWDDLGATSRPQRGPYYPDDVLPTVAGVVGWNKNNPKKNQTIYTDGNHAMLVSDVNSSGGGGSLGKFIATETNQVGGSIILGGTTFHSGVFGYSSSDPIVLLQIEVNPNVGGATPPVYCEWSFGIDKNGVNPSYLLYSGNFHKNEWTQAILPRTQWVMPYAPIDWINMGITANHGTFWIGSSGGDLNFTMSYTLGH